MVVSDHWQPFSLSPLLSAYEERRRKIIQCYCHDDYLVPAVFFFGGLFNTHTSRKGIFRSFEGRRKIGSHHDCLVLFSLLFASGPLLPMEDDMPISLTEVAIHYY